MRDNEADLSWDPLLTVLPAAYYQLTDLGTSPANWSTQLTYNFEIREVHVVAPIHTIPYVANVDHTGSHSSTTTYLQFYEPGVYGVRIVFNGGQPADTTFFSVGGGIQDRGQGHGAIARWKEVPHTLPAPYTTIMDKNSPTIAVYRQVAPNGKEVGTVTEAITKIKDAGLPRNVVFFGHGNSRGQGVGSGTAFVATPDTALEQGREEQNRFGSELNGQVPEVLALGCNVAVDIDKFQTHWMRDLSARLSSPQLNAKVSGYDAAT